MRYRWQACPNPDVSVLHTDVRLPYGTCEDGRVGDAFHPLDDEDKQ